VEDTRGWLRRTAAGTGLLRGASVVEAQAKEIPIGTSATKS
jgi:hypothetical protein